MQSMTKVYRFTIYADHALENDLVEKLTELGAKGYTVTDGRGSGEKQIVQSMFDRGQISRIEVIVHPDVAQKIVDYLNHHVLRQHAVTACVDEVKVFRADHF